MVGQIRKVWIVGANGGLGLALTRLMLNQGHQVTAMSRRPCNNLQQLQRDFPGRLAIVVGDINQHGSESFLALADIFEQYGLPSWTINAAGLLHEQSPHHRNMPEKRLSQVTRSFLADNIQANTYTSIAIAQFLDTLYRRDDPFRFLCLSAMVGSISDNRSGGWYSYRMSKAALNMFVKTLSIEWQRRFPHACIAAIHPGTTDTPLSIPFQNNISSDKLYTPQLSADRIYRVLSGLDHEDSGKFFHWDGSEIAW
ncbi:SDR family NAD(P)-dependent oxidoreductase [Photobacterium rosenbergii]|uniref:SDR family NAD(P)-dependent oxidoreductase n=1 Tax=Photobacterium rosenbergii TaxID=294936 RepID=UPI001C9A01AD|nr:SDR family NAD(P)-dependent oxidoreductase [Photobacterium rosenbergii]MBY5945308.1 SDR family NAD(P)-dependent oxidoreductase [Photobacterium rosenbergii]